MSMEQFLPVAVNDLPTTAGVVMVCCPNGLNAKATRIIALVEAENIRQLVADRSISWATECSTGYLEYLIALESDPIKRSACLQETKKRHKLNV